MPKINIDPDEKYPRPSWPQELKEDGYVGELTIKPNACVLVIPKPGVKNEDIAKSLEILAADYRHQAEMEKAEADKVEQAKVKEKVSEEEKDVERNRE